MPKVRTAVRSGIDKLKSVQIMVHQDSVNVISELRNYAWKRDYKTNQVTNQPEDDNNHALDALRYVAMEKLKANAGQVHYSIDGIYGTNGTKTFAKCH